MPSVRDLACTHPPSPVAVAMPQVSAAHARHRAATHSQWSGPRHRRFIRRRLGASALALILAGGAAAAVSAQGDSRASAAGAETGPELVVNGSFEHGQTGWRTNDAAATPLRIVAGGVNSAHAARMTSSTRRNAVLNDTVNTVAQAQAGTEYRVGASVRVGQPGGSVELRVRQVSQDGVQLHRERIAETDTAWHRLSFTFTVPHRSSLDLNVVAWSNPPGRNVFVDRVSMVELISSTTAQSTGTPTSTPTTPAAAAPTPIATASTPPAAALTSPSPTVATDSTPPTPASPSASTGAGTVAGPTTDQVARPLSNGCTYSQRGIPSCGAYVGAAIGANDGPSSFESKVGGRLGVHRSFWQASQVSSAVAYAKADVAAGRLPWISFKLPYSWADMAAGRGDAWALDIARQLSEIDGPVWVAFHHEPETDGDIREWTAIQRRLSPIVRKAAPNVAYTIILTGYHQVYGADEYHLDSLWPADTKVDVLGFDIYDRYGTDGSNKTAPTDLKADYFDVLSAWAEKHQVPWALGETGATPESFAADPSWLAHQYAGLRADGGIAFSYFDSTLNATGDWILRTSAQFDGFNSILSGSPRLPTSG